MIYYCIYKDKCSNKKCKLRVTETRCGTFSEKDLCTEGFICTHIDHRYILLTSKERLVCENYLRCPFMECIIKRNYFTKKTFGGNGLVIICPITNEKINLITEGNNSTCLSIWE
jgi:nitrite reductase/ring-hydroxylating ferredoxin subunit